MKFSILNLLLILTTAASIMGIYAAWRTNSRIVERYEADIAQRDAEISQLQASLKSLRQEAGALTIDDPTKIHAMKLRTTSDRTWSYRVYLPEGNTYFFASKINSLPSGDTLPVVESPPDVSTTKSLPGAGVTIGRESGEYVVTLSVERIGEDWRYRLRVRKSGDAVAGATGGSVIRCTEEERPNKADWQAEGGVFNQAEFSVDQECLLLDFRAVDKSLKASGDSKQGAMLWVGIAK